MNLSLNLNQEGALHPSCLVTLFEAKGYDCEETTFDTYTLYRFKADRSEYIEHLKSVYRNGNPNLK